MANMNLPRPVLMRAVNADLRPEDHEIYLGPPRLMRSTNSHELLSLPVILTPGPPLPLEEPPRLTREDERRRVTAQEIAEMAVRLF